MVYLRNTRNCEQALLVRVLNFLLKLTREKKSFDKKNIFFSSQKKCFFDYVIIV